jgi:catechol 2,3-dioxygenase-like lactoylglutathione lyase family enzyme
MIDRIGSVSIFVSDQDRAREFYTKTLGFELREDAPLYPGATARWVSVAPAGAETEAILYLPDENWEHYRQVVAGGRQITGSNLHRHRLASSRRRPESERRQVHAGA